MSCRRMPAPARAEVTTEAGVDSTIVPSPCFAWNGPLILDQQEISLRDYPRFGNPYCHTEYNSGIYDIRFKNQTLQLDFTADKPG